MTSKPVAIPLPGQAVRGSRSGAPIMALLDLLGRRWAMGVLWTLAESGPATFRNLQAKCETISPAVLNQRLKDLRAARFVEHGPAGYLVTDLGMSIYRDLIRLRITARLWADEMSDVPDRGGEHQDR